MGFDSGISNMEGHRLSAALKHRLALGKMLLAISSPVFPVCYGTNIDTLSFVCVDFAAENLTFGNMHRSKLRTAFSFSCRNFENACRSTQTFQSI